ncbi:uncharacterized protein E0L32_007773 [Thyridium curvatum]|uniref:Uncharacterized protein n=1 Tax=Thyridium curvatum TaxID=1093900 RepID=A0A507ANS6_9PEZI|nr:uncharacterized protein E0L32_007773 [Thyridium curvatum]TPX11562.1 hypothetical protein E0L32_007773 [Thyridium curvatum]
MGVPEKETSAPGSAPREYAMPPPSYADASSSTSPLPPPTDPAIASRSNPGAAASQSPSSPAGAPFVPTSQVPTAAEPFNFPSDAPCPAYSPAAPDQPRRLIAIPQAAGTRKADAKFVRGYAPSLLSRGIPPQTWRAFLDTASAFLAATVSDQAVGHAADVGRHVGGVPKRWGKETASHARSVGRSIRDNARRGNLVGSAFGVIGGGIGLTVGAATRGAGALISLPFAAASAVASRPKTPRERATAYLAVANKDWLGARGLCARLVDTAELARAVGLTPDQLLAAAQGSKESSAEAQIASLGQYVEPLEFDGAEMLQLGVNTLWLVVTFDGNADGAM